MKKFLAGACAGAVVVGIAAVLLARTQLREKYEHGRNMGRLDGQLAAVEAIRAEFGEADSAGGRAVFRAKVSTIVASVVDGVKTVRVLPGP